MPRYLSSDTLRSAVRRLGESRAQGRLTDYLIIRRALRLGGEAETVTLSQRDDNFMTALREFTEIGDEDAPEPFFSPFAWTRESKSGYRTRKYASNGPSNTVQDWHGKPNGPIERIPDTRPAQVRLAHRTPEELSQFLLLTDTGAQSAPRAIDLAYWWFRATDIEERFGEDPTEDVLIAAMLDDLGLQAAEAQALLEFDQTPSDAQ